MMSFTEGLHTRGGWPKLLKVTTSKLVVAVACPEVVLVGLHWLKKGSMPCPGDGCPVCDVNPRRSYGFVGAAIEESAGGLWTKVVVTVPEQTAHWFAGGLLRETIEVGRSLVEMRRRTARSRVQVQTTFLETSSKVPAMALFEIWRTLAAVWKMERLPSCDDDLAGLIQVYRRTAAARLAAVASHPDKEHVT